MMKTQNITAIILAAGQGTRMKSATPKVMHLLGHLPLVQHVAQLLDTLGCTERILVTAPGMEDVRAACKEFTHVIQDKPLGTGHAVLAAEKFITPAKDVLVLYGDTPLVTPESIQLMRAEKKAFCADIAVLGMDLDEPGHYGRLVQNDEGFVEKILEYNDATAKERAITLCNSGIMLISGQHALSLLKSLTNKNAKGEFYLTDIVEFATQKGLQTIAIEGDPEEFIGVNCPEDLIMTEACFQLRQRQKFLEQGVRMQDPDTVYFAYDTEIAEDVLLEPHVFFGPGVKIETRSTIRAFSYLESCTIGESCAVGPFARIRPGTKLGKKVRVGNFVELKNTTVEEGSKIPHLSYVGDATLGKNVNIGAGTITCNYDGHQKHKTVLKDNVFIGSNTSLVAPITIGENALVGAGSTLTKDVPSDGLAIGRATQSVIDQGAKKFRIKHHQTS
jgi:bifunctional UDP-N-acetylglucosamine pyrophosphorylase/glucosamine-1-phosphate N-acetyltransferase